METEDGTNMGIIFLRLIVDGERGHGFFFLNFLKHFVIFLLLLFLRGGRWGHGFFFFH